MSKLDCTFLVTLHHLKIPENLGIGIELDKNVFLTNDDETIKGLIPEKLIPGIGLSEYRNIINAGAIVYTNAQLQIDKFDERLALIKFLKLSALLCQAFWLIKDNSVCTDLGHLIYKKNESISLHSNYFSSQYFNCTGETSKTDFSVDELNLLAHYQYFFFHLSENKSNHNYSALVTEHNRIQRASFFLQSARSQNDIGIRISHFCSAFECLFSISNSELRHRLAETISLILGKGSEEKGKIYFDIQKAYDLRSSITHGDPIPAKYLKNQYQMMKDVCYNCDEYMRKIFIRLTTDNILYHHLSKSGVEELQKYFLSYIFN
jgi:hypothetical protein